MEINTTAKDIVDIALAKLKNGESFSHLRCGDGEVAIMNREKFPENFVRFSKNHLGYELDINGGDEIKKLIEFGIVHSDILGLPEIEHLEHPKNTLWKLIREEYTRVFNMYNINHDNKKYCSINSHYQLLNSKELERLLNSVENITIITCRDIESAFKKKFYHIKRVELIHIPAEQAYEIEPKKSEMFPNIHDKVIDRIRSTSRVGHLCIFGAGFCGKDFGAHFKMAGGVAIDLGSVFDLWAGKKTRGKGKSKTARIETSML
jgi:hypothetical protein